MSARQQNKVTLFSLGDARRLLEVWTAAAANYSVWSSRALGDLSPSPGQLRQLLNIAYEASLLPEEGRFPKVHLLFQVGGGPLIGPFNGDRYVISYEKPLSFSVGQVRKIAASVNPTNSYLLIEAGSSTRAPLKIRGTCLSPHDDDWTAIDQYRRERLLPFPYVVVSIDGPARLTLRAGSLILARTQGGTIQTGATPVAAIHRIIGWRDMLAAALTEYVGALDERAGVAQHLRSPTLLKDAQVVVQVLLDRFIRAVRELGHGALVLVCSADEAARIASGQDDGVEVLHKLSAHSCKRIWRALLGAFTGEQHLFAEIQSHRGREEGRTALEFGAVQLLIEGVTKAYKELYAELELLASYANLDGALIISDRLDCVCFGSAVRDLESSDPPVYIMKGFAPDSTAQQLREKHYGTRHRAAFRFVYTHPHSIAVVVSHDGDVKVCYRHADRVQCHLHTFPPVAE